MAGIEISTVHWPLLLVKFDGQQTMQDVDYFIREMAAAQARKTPYASISLMRKYSSDRSQVQKVAQWMKSTADETKRWCIGNGIVSESLGFRFLLSSIFLVKPMPCPYQVCSKWDEAMSWIQGIAGKTGLAVPAVPNPWA